MGAYPFTTIDPNVGRALALVPDPSPLLGLAPGAPPARLRREFGLAVFAAGPRFAPRRAPRSARACVRCRIFFAPAAHLLLGGAAPPRSVPPKGLTQRRRQPPHLFPRSPLVPARRPGAPPVRLRPRVRPLHRLARPVPRRPAPALGRGLRRRGARGVAAGARDGQGRGGARPRFFGCAFDMAFGRPFDRALDLTAWLGVSDRLTRDFPPDDDHAKAVAPGRRLEEVPARASLPRRILSWAQGPAASHQPPQPAAAPLPHPPPSRRAPRPHPQAPTRARAAATPSWQTSAMLMC